MANVKDTVIVEFKADTKNIDRDISKVEKSIKGIDNEANKASKSITNTKAAISSLIAVAGGMVAIKKAFDLGSVFLNTAAQFEQFETTLKSITGSSEQAKQSMAWIREFTAKTPFEMANVTDAFVKMKAYGLDPMDGTLQTLGNTASAMGKDIGQAVEAMADAVTGENERLKEFGVKAKLAGDTVAYSWSDSSGKARDIVIKNNKEMIQSTLNAIFNEKYIGAMQAQSNTWNGIISNMKDSWTNFQMDAMSQGLFVYLKAGAIEISKLLGVAFDAGKGSAKGFSDFVIGGIKATINAVGVLYDTWSGFNSIWEFLKTGFWQFVGLVGTGINTIQKAWNDLGNVMSQMWADMANGTKDIFANMINWVIEKINYISSTVNQAASTAGLGTVFGELSTISFEKTKANITALGEPISNVATAWKYASDAQDEYSKSSNAFMTGAGQKQAAESIKNVDKAVVGLTATEAKNNEEKDKAKKLLEELIAKSLKAGEAGSKGAKDTEKALKDATKQAESLKRKYLELSGDKEGLFIFDVDKQLNELMASGEFTAEQIGKAYDGMYKDYVDSGKDANKEIALDFTQQFEGLFQGLINGDFGGAIKGLFSGISMEMSKNLISSLSDSISSKIGSMFGGLGDIGSGLVGLGIGILGSLFGGNKEQTPPVLDDMAKTSESMADSLDYIKNSQNPMLALTREMTGYLSSISKAFGGAENSLLRSGLDLGGSTYKGTSKAGFLGLTGKSTELFGMSVNVASTSLANMMNGWVDATLLTTTKTVKKGIFKSSTTYEITGQSISNELGRYLAEATQAAFNSLTLSGSALGINTAGLANQAISIGTFDATGMSASEVAAQIEARFSAGIDAIAEQYFGAVREFQQSGEGLAETLYRVTVNFEQVGHSLWLIDKAVNWRTANIIADYAGGIDALNSSLSSYQQNFFTEQEQYQMQVETMTKNFASLGMTMPTTNEQFRALIESLDTTTDGGAKTFAEMIGLADAFSEMTSAGDELAKALEETTTSITDMIKQVSDAWLGNLSYLTIAQKAEYASGYLAIASQSNGTINTVEAARLAAETALNSASTKEQYIPVFDRYIKELEAQAPEATTDDVVARLDTLIARVKELEETTRQVAV